MLKVSLPGKGRSTDDVNYHQTLTRAQPGLQLGFQYCLKIQILKENGILLYH